MLRAALPSHLVAPTPAVAARHAGLRALPPRPTRAAARPAAASARHTAQAAPVVLAEAAALGLWKPALVAAAAPLTGVAAAGAALLAGLSLDGKDLKGAILAAAGLTVAAQLAPFLAQAALGAAPALEPTALLAAAAKNVLLPLLAGVAVKAALPGQVVAVAPLLPIAALALVSLVCGTVVAGSAEAARAAGGRLFGAVAAAQAGTAALLFASSKAGLPVQGGPIAAGTLVGAAGAALAHTLAPAQPLLAVACVGSALVSALAALLPGAAQPVLTGATGVSSSAQSDGAQYLREVLQIPLSPKPAAAYSWQLPADTYLTVLRSRDEGAAQAAASAPAVPANVAEARAWIAAWRGKQRCA
ncbi:bile acid:sodium symporter [Chlorella sorokiniana]|uniref:Bile acid:sodium symporter n=1 Tax=Chlorella sorokiniana TaxID=3076 RepID=A0A2P6TVI0_CHLSO|nr:bile acid:sodium symporter [Chlorella sorokiniana]|eukprot:PRW58064.1 bile acid:sodium symporter [Chlorella sorokiniana]